MRTQEIKDLYEIYLQVHQPQEVVEEVEQLDELSDRTVSNALNARIAATGDAINRENKNRTPQNVRDTVRASDKEASMRRAVAKRRKRKLGEETDLFDYILEHLVAEGYADTNENALAIMANMSEEWRQSIVEDTINERVKYSDNDYRGGGGDEKRLRTGMSTREVSQLGRQNINRAIGKEPLGTQIKQKLFGREVPVPPNAGFKPGGSRMMPGSSPGTTADPLPGPRARYHGPAR